MDWLEILKYIAAIASGLAAAIPLVMWVLAMLKASADGINYDIDYDAIADMIDSLCDMSKVINPATPANKVTAKKEEGK